MATTATRFDAASDRATYAGGGGNPPAPSAGWSAAWWAYISVDQNTASTMLRLHGGGTVLNAAMGDSGTSPGLFTAGGSVEIDTQCTVGAWYYIAASVFGSAATIFVFDATGALFDSAAGSIGGGTPTGLTVGGRDAADPDEWFNGRISRMRIWSAVLDQTQFAAEQFAANPVITANLWEHWPLTGAGDLNGTVGGHNLAAGSTATTTEDGPPLPTGVTGSATATLGGLSATANGQRTALGSTIASLGGLGVAALGVRQVRGSATASLPALDVSAIAARRVIGQASTTLGALGATAASRRQVTGSALGTFGPLGATVSGRRAVTGTAAVALGRLIATVVVSDDHDVVVRARLARQGRLTARLGTRRVLSRLGAQR